MTSERLEKRNGNPEDKPGHWQAGTDAGLVIYMYCSAKRISFFGGRCYGRTPMVIGRNPSRTTGAEGQGETDGITYPSPQARLQTRLFFATLPMTGQLFPPMQLIVRMTVSGRVGALLFAFEFDHLAK